MAYHHRLQLRRYGQRLTVADLAALGLDIVDHEGQAAAPANAGFDIYESDEWFAERLDEHQIVELVGIAERLGADVLGDEGETCAIVNGVLVERQPAQPRSLWLQRNRWAIIYGLVLAVIWLIALIRHWPLF